MSDKPTNTQRSKDDIVAHLVEGAELFKRLGDTLSSAVTTIQEQQHALELQNKSTMRAIARWRMQNPRERVLRWPDHTDLVVWLLDLLDETLPFLRGNAHLDGCDTVRRTRSGDPVSDTCNCGLEQLRKKLGGHT